MNRIGKAEIAIMRIAVYEMMFEEDVPVRVAVIRLNGFINKKVLRLKLSPSLNYGEKSVIGKAPKLGFTKQCFQDGVL